MPVKPPLKVVLCWHMHQPVYWDLRTGEYQLPWVYLHGIKDYVDMAAYLEAVPAARAVINFVPTLLEQIDDYVQQIQDYFEHATALRDPLLAALVTDEVEIDLLTQCMRANRQRLIERFEPYHALVKIGEWAQKNPETQAYANQQYYTDLVMWYHLAWLGETVRRQDARVQTLMEKARHFDHADRQQLLQIIGELLSSIIPRYQALAKSGQVELSFTPYAHPILPLLLDLQVARETQPNLALPEHADYPDGEARARWHIQRGIEIFEQYFGFKPQGCWASEGGVSTETVRLLNEFGLRWVASGENVLRNSLQRLGQDSKSTHQPFHLPQQSTRCFFRSDHLSDLIGFQFAKWHADDAVNHLIAQLETLARSDAKVVSIILDGENAWEYYPENAYYFLSTLYARLAENPHVCLSTFSECSELPATELANIVAGSWVYGTFSTWIGDKDKNRGWDMLIEAKQVYDKNIHQLSSAQQQRATRQLAICEGSDWFWWFGDYNPADSVRDFDQLYRLHLANLYHELQQPIPENLAHALSAGSDNAASVGTMRKSHEDK
jgi:alpha-amylase/alpha-mannosidase (GH57 family)